MEGPVYPSKLGALGIESDIPAAGRRVPDQPRINICR